MRNSKQLFILLIGALSLILLLPLSVLAANLIINNHLEPPFAPYGTTNKCGQDWPLQIATGWKRFDLATNDRLKFYSASEWGELAACLYGGTPHTESLGGEAQVWTSARKFDTGIYQQVSGLETGKVYGFEAGILPVYYRSDRDDPATGQMLRSVGIDPYGGVDPASPNVIWGPEEPHATFKDPVTQQKYTWFFPSVGATAMSTTMTVFARVRSIEDITDGISINQVWVDATFMDVAPTTSLTLTAGSPTQIDAIWYGAPASGFHLFAYEVQYRKATTTTWTDLQIFDVLTPESVNDTTSISVEEGVDYIVRARTWHEQDGGDAYEVAGPWTEATFNTTGNFFSNPGLETFQANGVAEDWGDFTVSGLVTHTGALSYAAQSATSARVKEGDNAQVWFANDAFDAGIYQQVYSLTIGNSYGFVAYQTYAPTGASLTQSVGIDPAGGADPTDPNVIWSDDDTALDWTISGIGAEALSTTVTVFIRSHTADSAPTVVWADDTALGDAAVTSLSLSNQTPCQVKASWSSVPGAGYALSGYQVQYQAAGDSAWTDLHTLADGLAPGSKSFTATAGITYTARARSWQQAGTQAIPGPWTEKSIVPQAKLQGLTLGNMELLFQGAVVSVVGESLNDESDYYGKFDFILQPGNHILTASNSAGWHTRAPVTVAVSNTQATSVTLTLIPPDDVIVNGAFEDDLNGWQHTFSGNVIGSGYISAGLVITQSGVLSQSGNFSNAYTPTLTFWYKIEGSGGALNVRISGRDTLSPTTAFTFTQPTDAWKLAVLPLNLAEYVPDGSGGSMLLTGATSYTGPVSARFTTDVPGGSGAVISLDEVVFGSAQPARKMPAIYLPMVMKNYSPPPPPSVCPTTSTRSYHTIPVNPPPIDHPDYLHGDLNLSLRGWEPASAALTLIDYSGSHDSNAPQMAGFFANNHHRPQFTSAYKVYDWNWSCGEHGCRGDLLTQWSATLLGLQTTPGEEIAIPTRSPNIYQNYKAVVIYAEEQRITFVYIRMDRIATLEPKGYAVHIEDVCVDPNLLALYRASLKSDGYRQDSYQLPGLTNDQILGTAIGSEIKVAIRDGGTFMDPRSRLDWWQGY